MPECISKCIEAVHPDQRRFVRIDAALHKHEIFVAHGFVEIAQGRPFSAPTTLEPPFTDLLDIVVMLTPECDQVPDSPDVQGMAPGEGDEVGQPRHRPVFVHDLADDAGRIKSGQARNVDRRFGMPCANQDPAGTRGQRKDMTWRYQRIWSICRVDGNRDRPRAVGSRDARRYPAPCFDRDGERRVFARAVRRTHHRKGQLGDARFGQREADETLAVCGHEVDGVGRGHLTRNDKVSLIFAVFVINQNEHPAISGVVDNGVDRRDGHMLFLGQRWCDRSVWVVRNMGIASATRSIGVMPWSVHRSQVRALHVAAAINRNCLSGHIGRSL